MLTPLAALYAGALELRRYWWQRMAQQVEPTVISVGNLTIGGNGKTPFTLFLASRLRASGANVGIVSRGYGGLGGRRAALVSNGRRLLMSAREAGDEAVMMAKSFDGPVAIARRRIEGIGLLGRDAPIDVVILDDAFQHLRLKRDLNLLLVRESRGFGNEWILPAGPLRESLRAIARADAIVMLSSVGMEAVRSSVAARARLASKPILRATLAPRSLVRCENGKWREGPLELSRRRVVAVSGIADAQPFHAMIRQAGAEIIATLEYPDHHDYALDDWHNIMLAARSAEVVVTTEKDLVKLARFSAAPVPLCALRIQVVMEQNDTTRLCDMIARCLSARPTAHSPGTRLSVL